jgi:NTE family protein
VFRPDLASLAVNGTRLVVDLAFGGLVGGGRVESLLLSRAEQLAGAESEPVIRRPPLAQICGVFLNAIFLDHLDADVDHLRRMNELIAAYEAGAPTPLTAAGISEPMRFVEPLIVSPSEDLALVARTCSRRMPRVVRYLLEGLGTPDAQSADLMSYLLFDAAYTRTLIDIGYRDAGARTDEIEALLRRDAAEEDAA